MTQNDGFPYNFNQDCAIHVDYLNNTYFPVASLSKAADHHSVVPLIRFQRQLLLRSQPQLFQYIDLRYLLVTSFANTMSGALVESMQFALILIRKWPPFFRKCLQLSAMILAWSG